MANFPGPYELRFLYTTVASGVTRSHSHRVNVILAGAPVAGLAFSGYDVVLRDSTTDDLQTIVDNYFAVMEDVFHTSADFPSVELWKYTPLTYDAAFWAGYALAGSGASASAAIVDGQSILTFRTSNGGSMRLVYMEGIANAGITQTFPTASAQVNAIGAFITSAIAPFVGRDNGYPIAALHYLPGVNEGLTKDRLRP
jgi:hypothetical protein